MPVREAAASAVSMHHAQQACAPPCCINRARTCIYVINVQHVYDCMPCVNGRRALPAECFTHAQFACTCTCAARGASTIVWRKQYTRATYTCLLRGHGLCVCLSVHYLLCGLPKPCHRCAACRRLCAHSEEGLRGWPLHSARVCNNAVGCWFFLHAYPTCPLSPGGRGTGDPHTTSPPPHAQPPMQHMRPSSHAAILTQPERDLAPAPAPALDAFSRALFCVAPP